MTYARHVFFARSKSLRSFLEYSRNDVVLGEAMMEMVGTPVVIHVHFSTVGSISSIVFFLLITILLAYLYFKSRSSIKRAGAWVSKGGRHLLIRCCCRRRPPVIYTPPATAFRPRDLDRILIIPKSNFLQANLCFVVVRVFILYNLPKSPVPKLCRRPGFN